jgi:AraC-like DNA-binding protein
MTYVPSPGQADVTAVPAPEILTLREMGSARALNYRCAGHPGQACWQDRHQQWSLVLAQAGGFVYRTDRGARLIEPGMAIVTSPGEAYQCDHPFGAGDEALVVTLPERPPGLANRATTALLPSVAAIAHLTAAVHHPHGDGHRLFQAVASLIETSPGVPPLPLDDDDLTSGHVVLSQLTALGDDTPSVSQLGQDVGLSRFGVNRLVRRLTGLTPHQYRIRRRLAAAAYLLRTTDRPVTTIAADVGWGDLSTFLHAFRHHLGCSPGAFRQRA